MYVYGHGDDVNDSVFGPVDAIVTRPMHLWTLRAVRKFAWHARPCYTSTHGARRIGHIHDAKMPGAGNVDA